MSDGSSVIIIGSGLVAVSTAWRLAAHGVAVTLLDPDPEPGVAELTGSAHELPYRLVLSDRRVAQVQLESIEAWRQLERRSLEWSGLERRGTTPLLAQSGEVHHGHGAAIERRIDTLTELGVSYERLAPTEAHRRWPSLRFDGSVVVHHEAGYLDGAAALGLLRRVALEAGATVRNDVDVRRVETLEGGGVRVVTEHNELVGTHVVFASAASGSVPIAASFDEPSVVSGRFVSASEAPWPAVVHHTFGGGRLEVRPRIGGGGPITLTAVLGAAWPGPVAATQLGIDAVHDLRRYVELWLPGLNAESGELVGPHLRIPVDLGSVLEAGDPIIDLTVLGGGYEWVAPGVADRLARALRVGGAPQRPVAVESTRRHVPELGTEELDVLVHSRVLDNLQRAGTSGIARRQLLVALDQLDTLLEDRRYLFGASPTATDLRLIDHLVWFDQVLNDDRSIIGGLESYPALWEYVRRLQSIGGFFAPQGEADAPRLEPVASPVR